MKTNFMKWAALFSTMVLAAGCAKDSTDEIFPENDTPTVRISANAIIPETRVNVGDYDDSSYPLTWGEGDAIAVVELSQSYGGNNGAAIPQFDITNGAGEKAATFEGEIGETSAKYYAVYPYSAFFQFNKTYPDFNITFPSEQTPGGASLVDPAAVILVSDAADWSDTGLELSFNHIAAYAKMTLKNLHPGTLKNIVFATTDTDISGSYYYYYDELSKSGSAKGNYSYKSITVNADNLTIADDGSCEVYFSLFPGELSRFTVTANYTDGDPIVRNCEPSSALKFEAGNVLGFKIDMSKVEEKPEVEPLNGDYVILAWDKNKEEYFAAAGVSGSNKYLSNQEFADFTGSESSVKTSDAEIIWTITNVTGNTYTVQHNGSGSYLYYKGSGNEAYLGDSSELTIEPNDDGATYQIKSGDNRILAYNTSSPRFAFYTGSQVKDLYLIPVKSVPSITVAQSELNIAAEGEESEIEVVVKNHTSEVSVDISYESGSNWIKADWSNNMLSYTIYENTDETERTATITIKASNENGETSQSIAVKQIAAGSALEKFETFTITSDNIVGDQNYKAHTNTVDGRGWVITFGGNNKSVGTNSNNRNNCTLSSYSKYAVSPVTTSSTASAFASTTEIANVSKIEYTFNGGSSQTSTKVYLLYSADGNTFSQMNLTSGTQGGTISSGTAFEFEKCSGYFAVLFQATNSSGNWRIDDVQLTFTYSE